MDAAVSRSSGRRGGALAAGASVALMILAASAASGAPDEAPTPAPAPGPGPAAWQHAYARVDGVAVLRTEVDALAKRGIPAAAALQQRITLLVLERGLRAAGADPARVGAKELDEAVAEARAQTGGKLEEALQRAGQSLAEFRESLRVPLCFRQHVRAALTDERLKSIFETRKLAMAGELRLSHLLVRVRPGQPPEAARAKVAALRKQLGDAPTLEAFARLAGTASEDPMASLTGGDLDWARPGARTTAPLQLVRAAFHYAKRGLLPEPVRSGQGLHLVFVADLRLPPSATFERLRPKLLAEVEREEADRLLVDWREHARVEYAPDAPRPGRR